MTRRPWTPEALAEVCRRYPHERTADIASDLGRSIGSIHGQANMLGLKKSPEYMREIHGAHIADAGARYRFNAGSAAWNKGIPGSTGNHPNTRRTQFKPGRAPEEARNYQPIGTLRICKDGYLERKVTDDQSIAPARRWVGAPQLFPEAMVPPPHWPARVVRRRAAKLVWSRRRDSCGMGRRPVFARTAHTTVRTPSRMWPRRRHVM